MAASHGLFSQNNKTVPLSVPLALLESRLEQATISTTTPIELVNNILAPYKFTPGQCHWLLFKLAILAREKNNLKMALMAATLAATAKATVESYLLSAEICFQQKEVDKAFALIDSALKCFPQKAAKIYHTRAQFHLAQHEWEAAFDSTNNALACETETNRKVIYCRIYQRLLNQPNIALTKAQKAIILAYNALSYFLILEAGYAYSFTSKHSWASIICGSNLKNAIKYICSALEHDKDNPKLYEIHTNINRLIINYNERYLDSLIFTSPNANQLYEKTRAYELLSTIDTTKIVKENLLYQFNQACLKSGLLTFNPRLLGYIALFCFDQQLPLTQAAFFIETMFCYPSFQDDKEFHAAFLPELLLIYNLVLQKRIEHDNIQRQRLQMPPITTTAFAATSFGQFAHSANQQVAAAPQDIAKLTFR